MQPLIELFTLKFFLSFSYCLLFPNVYSDVWFVMLRISLWGLIKCFRFSDQINSQVKNLQLDEANVCRCPMDLQSSQNKQESFISQDNVQLKYNKILTKA